MNILLLGATGQIGNALRRTLLPLGRVVAPSRAQADLADLDSLAEYLRARSPDIIVNAAAHTAVDAAEADEGSAWRINADAVAIMAAQARDSGAVLVHYSTDYVFDGSKPAPYIETDTPRPLNAYGRSKLAAEHAIAASGCRALVLRTSWVYAAHGRNFVKTVLELARQRETLRVVADQVGSPTSAELVADVTALALAAHHRHQLADGIYHLTAAGSTTWYQLACHTVQRAHERGMMLRLQPQRIQAICTEDYPLPAPRPRNSRLDTGRLAAALGLQLPDWTAHLELTINDLVRHANETRQSPP